MELFKNITPGIIKSFKFNNYNVVVHQLLKSDKRISWKEWPRIFPIILKKIMIRSSPVVEVCLDQYCEQIYLESEKAFLYAKFMTEYCDFFRLEILGLLKHYMSKDIKKLYKVFAHGDLTPNNIIVFQNNYKLIDFANGGDLNLLYDLMVQNVYFARNETWTNFDRINFKNNFSRKIFFGSSGIFIKNIEDIYGVSLTESEIKLSLIFSLAEIFIKNFQRYQSEGEYLDGNAMLNNIKCICEGIKGSLCAQS